MTTASSRPAAIVTGAGAGIGRAIAMALADDGYRVIVAERDGERAAQTAALIREAGGAAEAAVLDICDSAACAQLIAGTGELAVLVNNAGIFDVKDVFALTPEDFRRMYDVNLVALFGLSQAAARVMKPGGRIVNIASRAMLGARHYAHYVASKAAVAGLTRAMALEFADRDITVNAVAPGVIETEMLRARSDTNLDALRALQPSGRLGESQDIAHAVAFLASPKAGFITGQVLIVDGGRSLGGSLGF
ncbi:MULTISPECIES: SDR family NAD(P)-dependent oxidoreductase [unclassified Chelatococcus]|uniref:SDR family NAD(P)-dependent oxidoreductase n=1 Tax=unclassified Chelatococcus TaxID=2638111 RepID=UPI0002E524BF|nr:MULTISPECIES: SDR family NAD(P)-dependent oxidoreductase [unclassified Chelatococcus]ALA20396.1 short-chain dehydrogenase [Chelatococcus sp. CO-6]